MKNRIRKTVSVSAMLTAILCLLMCAGNGFAAQKVSSVTFAQGRDISGLDPYNALGTTTTIIKLHMYSGLTQRDVNGKVVPYLAESYKKIDATTIEFKLRKGVKFHNGEVFNAQTVLFSFNQMKDPNYKNKMVKDFSFLKEVQIVDDYTVRLISKKPFGSFALRLVNFVMLPPKYIKKNGIEYWTKHPVGTGPYKFNKWHKGEKLILDAFDGYFEGAPAIKKVIFRVIPEAASRVAALEAGEVDLISSVPENQAKRLSKNPNINVINNATTRVIFIGLNTLDEKSPTYNKKFRQALNYAVDVDAIVKHIFGGKANKIATVVAPNFFGFSPNVKPYPFDPEKAKKLLTEIGYKDETPLYLTVVPGAYINNKEVAQTVAGQLGKVGVTVRVVEMESSAHRSMLLKKTTKQMYLLGIGGSYNDADLTTLIAFGTKQRYSTFNNSEFDALRQTATSTVDNDEALNAWQKVQEMAKEEAPAIFLYQQFDTYAYNKRLKNWKPKLDELIFMYGASIEK